MKYCTRCGVTVDEDKHRFCPLCNTIILKDTEIDSISFENIKIIENNKKEKNKNKIKKKSKNKLGLASFVVLLSLLTAIFTLIIVDLSIGFDINWSLIPIISIILFILLSLPIVIPKKLYSYFTFDTIIISLYFLILNYLINQRISWSYIVILSLILVWVYLSAIFLNRIKGFILKIAIILFATAIFVLLVTFNFDSNSAFSQLVLPINGLVFILSVISYLFIKTYIYNLYIIISTLSINISILCIGLDLLIQRFLTNELTVKWSYIVLLVLIPFTILMLYLNNRYKIHKYFIKKFHI